ncbi:transglutaminase family protein [Marinagarivorans algicola]|uniref:transglutaminase family protein n=1 Tax=Marinagarivorans algicola TaxID=1513270 RepID=UPI0037352075
MLYRICHITEYLYNAPVSHCYNLAHIIPRTSYRQKCISSDITLEPAAAFKSMRDDYFGNRAYHFEIQRSHKKLVLTATSKVETRKQFYDDKLEASVTCAEAWQLLQYTHGAELLMAREFLLDSPMIKIQPELRAYAEPLFTPNKPLLQAVMDLTQKIFTEFEYSPASTTIATPLDVVLNTKKGVCQDFAHLQIACLRALGIPAKYISGYIETLPPPGQEKLVGTDASHAWVSAFCPGQGWVEFDPTNNSIAAEQHILTAWGRDYFDVTPLKGVIFGGGENPILNVSVDVARV